ncbi:hypothetical protein, partial [Deinococcus marmoris]|uniref:hypothetical protein n=1 Tax=Deinococcus marmoris TaxID=249408 RepID=UPI0039EFDEB5
SSCLITPRSRLSPSQMTTKCSNVKNAVQDAIEIELSGTEMFSLATPSTTLLRWRNPTFYFWLVF